MKCGLLSLHPFNQFLDPIKHGLIRDAGRHVLVMLDLAVEFVALVTHGTHLKVTGGKQPATCYLMNAAGLFCFNQITGGLRRWFRDHAASLYLVGDGSGRLLGQRAYQHWSAPKLDRILARKALGLSDGLAIISANHRLIPDEVPLRSHHVSAVFWHHRGACKPGDVSHSCM
jgi:hypothetical protein